MKPATRTLVARALKLREAGERAALGAAQNEHARRVEAAQGLAATIEAEGRFAAGGAQADPGLSGPIFAMWREAAGARLAQARQAAGAAEAACEPARAALSDTLRTTKGFETLMARRDDERARAEARRDPLAQLMLLPRRP
jgi:hypothetical protein